MSENKKNLGFKYYKNNQKGITLLALIVTIIVLLILAGVSISLVLGDNGVLTQAQKAKTATEEAQMDEQIKMIVAEIEMENWTKGTNKVVTRKEVEDKLAAQGKTVGEIKEIMKKVGYQYPYIPEGFVHVGGSWNTGYIISDAVADENKGESTEVAKTLAGNQFVWVPVSSSIGVELKRNLKDRGYYSTLQEEAEGNGYSTIEDYVVNGQGATSVEEFLEWNGYSTVEEYNAYLGPKESEEYILDFRTSVIDNGGYYIARYEAGMPGQKPGDTPILNNYLEKNIEGVPVSKANVIPWYYISWTKIKANAEKMYEGHSSRIKSKLINSYAWDTALSFMEKSGDTKSKSEIYGDSKNWGNYKDIGFDFNGLYIDGNDIYNDIPNYQRGTNKPNDTAWLLATGVADHTRVNNIYDMAGNISEWTTEFVEPVDYTWLGGCYVDQRCSAGYTSSDTYVPYGVSFVGFRVILYK